MSIDDLPLDEILNDGMSLMPSKPFHNAGHVRRVHEAVRTLASGKSDREKAVLRVAAAYHDVGHSSGADGHEKRSVGVARSRLTTEFGLDTSNPDHSEFLSEVENCIMSTKMDPTGPFHPNASGLGKYLADADVHNFGLPWNKFHERTLEVKKEQGVSDIEDWYEGTLGLIKTHSWNANGGSTYPNKSDNIAELEERLSE